MKRKILGIITIILLFTMVGMVVFRGQNTVAAYEGKWKLYELQG